MEKEIWRDITGYEGRYQISSFGRIKSFWRGAERILKAEISRNGYLRVDLRSHGSHKHFCVHRLVANAFVDNPNLKPQINHRDGNKLNNQASNLEWVTATENIRHAIEEGLRPSGENCFNARLTAEQVVFIRDECKNLTQKQVAAMFNVNPATINEIRLGKTYRNAGGTIRKSEFHKPPIYLTETQKQEIRQMHIKGDRKFGARALAKKYGTAEPTIYRIVREK